MNDEQRNSLIGTFAALIFMMAMLSGCGKKEVPPPVAMITESKPVTVVITKPVIEKINVPIAVPCEVVIPAEPVYDKVPPSSSLYDKAVGAATFILQLREDNKVLRELLKVCKQGE